jgi:hypothetical protein
MTSNASDDSMCQSRIRRVYAVNYLRGSEALSRFQCSDGWSDPHPRVSCLLDRAGTIKVVTYDALHYVLHGDPKTRVENVTGGR